MGSATIISSMGEGLYQVRLKYNTAPLETELTKLQNIESEYSALILKALNTLLLLEDDAAIARNAMNAILQQWIDAVIAKGNEQPEPIEPDDPIDPETGLPWVDPDRAQEAPLLDLINDARTAASVGTVSRDDDLDAACLAHLRYQAGTGGIGHIGQWRSKPSDRANQQGYYQPETIHELLAYGETSPARVISRWQREPTTWANLLADGVTHAGVAHVYAGAHPGSYLWAVLLASAKGDPVTNTVEEDPAKSAAEDTEAGLDAIKAPSLDAAKPEKLGEAVRLFALAQNKVLAADREIAKLMADRLARLKRIGALTKIQNDQQEVIDVWSCQWHELLSTGDIANTAEVPGYLDDELVSNSTTMGVRDDLEGISPDYEVQYTERSINLIPYQYPSGKLQNSETMTDAAIAYNMAIEPGHLKWKPLWRYGTITAKSGNTCSVLLTTSYGRRLSTESTYELDEPDNLTIDNVPISYPPCDGEVFAVNDEVLILFEGQNRNIPKVIGFRREPKPCPFGRVSWRQV